MPAPGARQSSRWDPVHWARGWALADEDRHGDKIIPDVRSLQKWCAWQVVSAMKFVRELQTESRSSTQSTAGRRTPLGGIQTDNSHDHPMITLVQSGAFIPRIILAKEAGPATALQDKLGESLHLATDLMAHVRELTQQFRPRILDDLGLRAAVRPRRRRLLDELRTPRVKITSLSAIGTPPSGGSGASSGSRSSRRCRGFFSTR